MAAAPAAAEATGWTAGGSAGPAGASSNHSPEVGLEGSAGSVGELYPAGGARGKMISQAGGGSVDV